MINNSKIKLHTPEEIEKLLACYCSSIDIIATPTQDIYSALLALDLDVSKYEQRAIARILFLVCTLVAERYISKGVGTNKKWLGEKTYYQHSYIQKVMAIASHKNIILVKRSSREYLYYPSPWLLDKLQVPKI